MSTFRTSKPLGGRCYGSIGHLPNSRLGSGDHAINAGQARICTVRARDRKDRIIVQEKLDGTNVGVARIEGAIVPLIRAGYPAISARYEQHHLFAAWVFENQDRFLSVLHEGERVCGEWLAQVHGTRYALPHEPFVAFDLMRDSGMNRWPFDEFQKRIEGVFPTPRRISDGPPTSVEFALSALEDSSHHGAVDPIEGAVWRVERAGAVDFLAKWVRPDKVDGAYLPEVSGEPAIWNWRPKS